MVNIKAYLKNIAIGLGIFLIYTITARFGLSLAFHNPSATAVWAPTGIAISSLLIFGYRFFPVIFIASFLINMAISSPQAALGIAIGNTLEGILGAFFTNRFSNGSRAFRSTYDIFKFVLLVGIFATALSATIGILSLLLNGFIEEGTLSQTWITWWLGDAVGAVLIVPFAVLWAKNFHVKWNLHKTIEFVGLVIVIFLMSKIVFGQPFLKSIGYPLKFSIMPITIWCAFSFGKRATATSSILVTIAALWNILNSNSLDFNVNHNLLILQLFMGIYAVTGLVLAALVSQREHAENKLTKSLKEKDTLLKEVHHRVKNNLQIISSLLSLQAQNSKDEQVISTFKESQSRIKAMSIIHENLYSTRDVGSVNINDYAKKLVESLLYSYGTDPKKIEIDVNAKVILNIDNAIRCGLIINELITNSLKYAFPKGKGKIKIHSHYEKDKIILSIADNGKGFPKNFDFEKTQSLGIRLVRLIVNQLMGSLKISIKRGTSFKITFPRR